MGFSLDARAHSETGPVRKNNQDSAYISGNIILVADGMGGAAAGDIASAVAVRHIADADARLQGENMLEAAAGAMSKANDTIADLIVDDPTLDGMGTTVCGAMFSGTQLGVVHIGDSRGYLLRDGQLTHITHDHSWVQALVDEGKLSEAEAAVHPHRNLLLRVLNGQPVHQPDLWLVDIREGDRLMFCSDGLCGLVDDDVIAQLLGARIAPDGDLISLDDSLWGLVDAARRAGGYDNITVIVADVVAQSDDLDAVPGEILGAAGSVTIPTVRAAASVDLGDVSPMADIVPAAPIPTDLDPSSPPPGLIDPDPEERQRYSPTKSRRRLIAPIVSTVLAVVVLALAAWGGQTWVKSQYYVGASDDQVTIFRGVPANILGWQLSEPYETYPTLVTDLPTYYENQVRAGMTPGSLDKARQTTNVLKDKAQACVAKRAANRPATSAPPSTPAPPSTSASPTASASLSSSPDAITSTSSAIPPSIEDEGCR